MPGPAHAALTPTAAGTLAYRWPIEILVADTAVARRASASRALGDAIGALVAQLGLESIDPAERAIVVGTESAAVGDTTRFAREIADVGASLVNPALFPLTVMNATSGLAAIEHQCRGPNVTLSNGPASALDALAAAADLLVDRGGAVVFAGGFETLTDAPPEEAALAVVCALVAGDGLHPAKDASRTRLVAAASAGGGIPPNPAGLSLLASAATETAGDAIVRAAGVTALTVHDAASALTALAQAIQAPDRVTVLVAQRRDDSAGTALIFGPRATTDAP